MKRVTVLFLTLLLLALTIGVYLIVILLLRDSVQEEEATPLTSRDPAFMLPALDEGVFNPYVGELKSSPFDPMLPATDFSLPATGNQTFTLSDYQGKIVLLYFGYLSCPDFCPTTMSELRQVFIALGAQANEIQVLFITVDPERDDLGLMERYVTAFDDRFMGARTDDWEVLTPILNNFGVTAVKREVDSAMGYLVDHTASVFVVDPEGYLVTRFQYGTPTADLIADLQTLLNDQP